METIRYYRSLDILSQSNMLDMSASHIINATGIDAHSTPLHHTVFSGRKDYYLMYMIEGNLLFKLNDGKTKLLSPGMGIFIHCNKSYDYYSTTDIISYYWIHFTGYSALETLERFGFTHEFIFDIGYNKEIVSSFHKMFDEFTLRKPDFIFYSSLCMLQIFVEIKRSLSYSKNNDNSLKKSISYINNNYIKDISIKELADMEKISISGYRSSFTKIMGISPKQYIITLRISYAANLLQFTDKPISEIASQCGYDDLSYFYRLFKKNTGLTPLECRDNYLANNSPRK